MATARPNNATFVLAYQGLAKLGKNRTAAEKAAIRKTRPYRVRVASNTQVTTNRGGWGQALAPWTQEQIDASVDKRTAGELALQEQPINQQITDLQTESASRQSALQRLQASIMPFLQQAGVNAGAGYQQAALTGGELAKGFSGSLANSADALAQADAAVMASFGAPQAGIDRMMETGGDSGAGNVLYGLGGYIPGQSLAREGAAASAYGAAFPGISSQVTRENMLGIQAETGRGVKSLRGQLTDLRSRVPEIRDRILQDILENERQKFGARMLSKEYGLKERDQALAEWEATQPPPVDPPTVNVAMSEQLKYAATADGTPILDANGKKIPWKTDTKPGKGRVSNVTKKQNARAKFSAKVGEDLPLVVGRLTQKVPNPNYSTAYGGDDRRTLDVPPTFEDLRQYVLKTYRPFINDMLRLGVTWMTINTLIREAIEGAKIYPGTSGTTTQAQTAPTAGATAPAVGGGGGLGPGGFPVN